ncbi:hypothetical protein ANN_22006 [Periplaneta americana]|uniref:DUF4817 domain-containing protein n=1 Tax=Periplaneta americana TaxID=6978 RepID=A0ABQ8S7X0_PERAM|nr:hypothetical protein ANN_22006 [Periplaneta americana]
MEKNGTCKWTDRIRNEAVLERVDEERIMLKLIRKRKKNWLGHWLRRNCLLKDALEVMVNGKIVQNRRRYQIIDNIWIICGDKEEDRIQVQSNHQLRMDVYTFPELADMVMCYGEARGNGRRALHMYQQQFQNRNQPHHTMFARLYQRLRDDESLPRRIADEPREFNLPTLPQRCITCEAEKLPSKYGVHSEDCHNPGDLRNYAVKLTGFLEFGKDAATLPPRGFDGHLSILLNEGCDWLLTRGDKISVRVRKTFIYDNQLVGGSRRRLDWAEDSGRHIPTRHDLLNEFNGLLADCPSRLHSQATKGNIEGGEFDPVLWIEFVVAQWSKRLVRRIKDPEVLCLKLVLSLSDPVNCRIHAGADYNLISQGRSPRCVITSQPNPPVYLGDLILVVYVFQEGVPTYAQQWNKE